MLVVLSGFVGVLVFGFEVGWALDREDGFEYDRLLDVEVHLFADEPTLGDLPLAP